MKRSFTHLSKDGYPIHMDLYGDEDFAEHPVIVYVHGFKGFKDWGFVPYAANYFAQHGFTFLAFNFSHNGIGKDPLQFTEFERFKQNTYSREIQEVGEILHLCSLTDFFGAYLKGNIGLIGHSRGGGIGLLGAAEHKEVAAVATWASVSSLDRFSKSERDRWRKQGFTERVNSRTGQVFQLGVDMLDEIERFGKSRLHVLSAVKKLERPLLIIHGQEDESVPMYEAEQLNVYGEPGLTELRLIPKVGHTFGAKHPFEASNESLDQVLSISAAFFHEHLTK